MRELSIFTHASRALSVNLFGHAQFQVFVFFLFLSLSFLHRAKQKRAGGVFFLFFLQCFNVVAGVCNDQMNSGYTFPCDSVTSYGCLVDGLDVLRITKGIRVSSEWESFGYLCALFGVIRLWALLLYIWPWSRYVWCSLAVVSVCAV